MRGWCDNQHQTKEEISDSHSCTMITSHWPTESLWDSRFAPNLYALELYPTSRVPVSIIKPGLGTWTSHLSHSMGENVPVTLVAHGEQTSYKEVFYEKEYVKYLLEAIRTLDQHWAIISGAAPQSYMMLRLDRVLESRGDSALEISLHKPSWFECCMVAKVGSHIITFPLHPNINGAVAQATIKKAVEIIRKKVICVRSTQSVALPLIRVQCTPSCTKCESLRDSDLPNEIALRTPEMIPTIIPKRPIPIRPTIPN
jgi:hypothetical protein